MLQRRHGLWVPMTWAAPKAAIELCRSMKFYLIAHHREIRVEFRRRLQISPRRDGHFHALLARWRSMTPTRFLSVAVLCSLIAACSSNGATGATGSTGPTGPSGEAGAAGLAGAMGTGGAQVVHKARPERKVWLALRAPTEPRERPERRVPPARLARWAPQGRRA